MGPGGIATIIAASALLLVASAFGYAIFRLTRLIDEAKTAIKSITQEFINGPIESINRISKNVEAVTEKVVGASDSFLSKGGPAVKALGFLASAAVAGKKRGKKK